MGKKIVRSIFRFLIILDLALIPLGCIPLLIIADKYNPLSMVFVAGFQVENLTSQEIRITPIGTVGSNGIKFPLPLCEKQHPKTEYLTMSANICIAPGQIITIFYDYDDINFSEIVVEDEDGKLYELIANSEPTKNLYQPLHQKKFQILNLNDLNPVSPKVFEAYQCAQKPLRKLSNIAIFFYLPIFVLPILLILYKRFK